MEKVLKETGDCGRSQLCYVSTAQSCRMVAAIAQSLMVFGLYNPGWHCSTSTLTNGADDGTTWDNISYHRDTVISATNDTLVNKSNSKSETCDVIGSCGAIDFNPASSTIVSEFGLICDDLWKAHLVISILNGGLLSGGIVWGQVGERFGRKVGLYTSSLVMGIACALAVFSPTWQVYAVFTFFIGLGATGAIANASVLSMEFLNSKWRARLSSMPIWNTGTIIFAVQVYILRDWRAVHLTTAALCGITCLGVFWVPESFNWLVLHGKISKAKKVASNIAKMNKKPISENVLEELISCEGKPEGHCTYLDLFKTPEIRYNVIKLSIIAVVACLVYDVIGFGIQSLPGNFYTNVILASVIEFPGVLLNGPMANRIGRRKTGVVLMSIGALCCATIVVLLLAVEESSLRDTLISVMAFITRSVMQAIINILFTYSSELLPTAVRNLGLSFFLAMMRAIGLFGPYMIPRDLPSMVASFSVLMASQIICIASFYSLMETKDKPLKNTI